MGGAYTGARAKFSYDSNANWRVFWSFDLGREDLNSTGRIPVASRSPLPVVAPDKGASEQQFTTDIFSQLGGDYRHATNDLQGYTDRVMGGFSQKIDWDLGAVKVSSISGFRDGQFDWLEDSSGLPNNITRSTADLNVAENHRQFSQELRLQWQASKEFSVMAGAYYLHESTQRQESFFFDNSTAISLQDNQSNNFAVFGKIEQQLNQNHFLSLGGRINVDQKHLKQEAIANNAPAIILQDFNHDQSQSWRDFSPRLAYRYQHNEALMLYSSISKGIKSGGFQGVPGSMESADRTINPESAWEFEMGVKTHGFDDRLRLNIATFYTRYRDLQVVQFRTVDNFGVFETSNAASAKLQGLEAEFIWSPNQQFSLFGSYAFLDAVYDQFNAISGEDFTGNSLRQAPRHSASLAAEYQQHLALGQLNLYLNYRYQAESYREPDNTITIQPAFQVLDANLSFKPTEQSWQLNLWAKNINNEAYITHLYVIGGSDYALYGTPRSYGLSLEFQF